MKRDKLDAIFSQAIREAYNWTCTWCGKYFPEGQRQGLHCSHIFSRRHMATRHFPWNAVAHCYSCHQKYGGSPVDGARWAESFLGWGLLEIVRQRHLEHRKYTKADKEEMYQHYKAELERIKKLRKEGVTGNIEVIPYD